MKVSAVSFERQSQDVSSSLSEPRGRKTTVSCRNIRPVLSIQPNKGRTLVITVSICSKTLKQRGGTQVFVIVTIVSPHLSAFAGLNLVRCNGLVFQSVALSSDTQPCIYVEIQTISAVLEKWKGWYCVNSSSAQSLVADHREALNRSGTISRFVSNGEWAVEVGTRTIHR